MTDVIRLRPLDDDGLERLLALASADADPADVMPPGWTPDRPDEFRAFYRGFLADAHEIVAGGRTVGMIRLTATGETGMWVARSARGRGVGLTALCRVVQEAPGRGIRTVTAETATANHAARTVLARAGARLTVDGDRVRATITAPTEPATDLADPVRLVAAYLDFYRDALLRKVDGLSEEDLRTSRVPSGWTPLALVKHLGYVELRWLRWTFAGEDVPEPRGNPRVENAEWALEEGDTAARVRAFYLEQCARSREIAARHDLAEQAARWDVPLPRPTLAWILFHLLQEYARHLGQLDVVREITDGVVGA
ncbi:GNAT family N-acetyltransferase [Saccharothrix obliqua]|uniref:GNAT family N-acetyltransferase n=1 Tax=Saccharothrix obliqua TaxID=2861747 RepID=UPI001C6052C6|nr:GNAT family N-acetyltransferase [Saccharothrix obliqua]MBW4718249.1 GNAT family N-acetyltransferase [Saccharothrix obliqua]